MLKHGNRLLRGCRISILGDIQDSSGHDPEQPQLSIWLSTEQSVGLHDLLRSLPISIILQFYAPASAHLGYISDYSFTTAC